MIVTVSTAQIANAATRAAIRRGDVGAGGAAANRYWSRILHLFGGRGRREVKLVARDYESTVFRLDGHASAIVTREAADAWMKAAAVAPIVPSEPAPLAPAPLAEREIPPIERAA